MKRFLFLVSLGAMFFVSCQDEYPLMISMSALLPGTSIFKGIEDLANKESNRILEMQKILKSLRERKILAQLTTREE